MTKRISLALLCVCLVIGMTGLTTTAAAAEPYQVEIEPFWQNVAAITLNMSRNGGTVTSMGQILGQAGTTAISASFTLARQNANGTFTNVDSWITNSSSMATSSSRSTTGQSAGTYRLSVTVRVTRNGTVETVSESHTMAL